MMYSSVSIFLHEIFSSLKTYITDVCLIEPLTLQKKYLEPLNIWKIV